MAMVRALKVIPETSASAADVFLYVKNVCFNSPVFPFEHKMKGSLTTRDPVYTKKVNV